VRRICRFNLQMGIKRTLGWIFLGIPAALGTVLAVAALYYANEVRAARNNTPALVAAASSRYGTQLTLADLSAERRAILLAVEDPAFMRHHGVDLTTPGAGMTTITQGLVKILYFPEGFEPGIDKIRQTLIAQYALNAMVSKEDQLVLFLNISYLGNKEGKPVHGYANAARIYFGKEFAALTDAQFISLVAMLIGPNYFKPGSPALNERVKLVQAYLAGRYQPDGLLDVEYKGKPQGTPAQEALIALLRMVTDAQPPKES
jgi:membrane peptidoglycan carboxypeptidase